MSSSEQWLAADQENGSFAWALLAAFAIEFCALALLLPLMTKPLPPAKIQAPVRLTIEAPPTPKPPAPKPQPAQPKPPPKPIVPPPPQPAMSPPLPVPPPPMPRPAPHHVRLVHQKPPPKIVPIQPPQPQLEPAPQPPAPAPPSAGQVDLFREAVRDAVQRAADGVFPDGMQVGGQAEITITYLNGKALSVSLTRSSGYPMLDAAAVKAGRIAAYPAPPPAFAGRVFPWTVVVIFQPAAPATDGD